MIIISMEVAVGAWYVSLAFSYLKKVLSWWQWQLLPERTLTFNIQIRQPVT